MYNQIWRSRGLWMIPCLSFVLKIIPQLVCHSRKFIFWEPLQLKHEHFLFARFSERNTLFGGSPNWVLPIVCSCYQFSMLLLNQPMDLVGALGGFLAEFYFDEPFSEKIIMQKAHAAGWVHFNCSPKRLKFFEEPFSQSYFAGHFFCVSLCLCEKCALGQRWKLIELYFFSGWMQINFSGERKILGLLSF